MKKTRLISCAAAAAFAVLLSFPAPAQPPEPYPVTINSQVQTAPALSVFKAEPRTFRVAFKDGSTASVVTNATVFFGWATNQYAQSYITGTWAHVSGSTGMVDFTLSASDVNFAPGQYIYFAGAGSTYRQGVFTINPSPWGDGVSAATFTSNVNMDIYTWTGGPFVRIGDTVTDETARAWAVAGSNRAATVASDLTTASNALQAQINGIDVGGSTTDSTARAWATAASNLAEIAASDNTAASNYFESVMATDQELSAAQADGSNQFYLASNPQGYVPVTNGVLNLSGPINMVADMIATIPSQASEKVFRLVHNAIPNNSEFAVYFYTNGLPHGVRVELANDAGFFHLNYTNFDGSVDVFIDSTVGVFRVNRTIDAPDYHDGTNRIDVADRTWNGHTPLFGGDNATLGVVTGNTFAANSFTGAHIGDGSGLTGVDADTIGGLAFSSVITSQYEVAATTPLQVDTGVGGGIATSTISFVTGGTLPSLDGGALSNIPPSAILNSQAPASRGNTGAEWTIDLSATTAPVLSYVQNGVNITNIIVTVSDTNDVAGVIVALDVSTTNSITFPASIVWAEGSAPTDATNQWHLFAVQAFRSLVTWASLGGSL